MAVTGKTRRDGVISMRCAKKAAADWGPMRQPRKSAMTWSGWFKASRSVLQTAARCALRKSPPLRWINQPKLRPSPATTICGARCPCRDTPSVSSTHGGYATASQSGMVFCVDRTKLRTGCGPALSLINRLAVAVMASRSGTLNTCGGGFGGVHADQA